MGEGPSLTSNMEKVCQVLREEVNEREDQQGTIISLKVPVQVMLRVLPAWLAGVNQMDEEARIMGTADDEDHRDSMESHNYAMEHMLSTITGGLTGGDPFKTFNLHARFKDAGVDVPVEIFEGEEGQDEE